MDKYQIATPPDSKEVSWMDDKGNLVDVSVAEIGHIYRDGQSVWLIPPRLVKEEK